MVAMLLSFAAALGLVAGSFCNVLIHRLPKGESIVTPPSHCPRCGTVIRWYQNLPVISWIFLLGRCASCKARISVRYPLVELALGGLFLASAWTWGATAATVAACLFCLWIVALSLIDLEHQILPDVLTYPGIPLGIASSFFVPWTDWRGSLAGGILGAAIPMLFIWLYSLKGIEAMGWSYQEVPRVVANCEGLNYCPNGCPSGAKRSMSRTLLPLAEEAGAKVITNCRVKLLIKQKKRVTGVLAALQREDGSEELIRIDASMSEREKRIVPMT